IQDIHPPRTDTQTHCSWYKYFILIIIVPHQNYSSTKHNNTKNKSPQLQTPCPCACRETPGLREGVFLRADTLPATALLKSLEGRGLGFCFCAHPSLTISRTATLWRSKATG
ncbi:mCG1049074, partial [Mus musculus]